MNRSLTDSEGGLYIHVAYCRRKCLYCDFFSAGERMADWTGYVDALIKELEYRIDELPCPLRTVYVGGGTPSLMPAKDFLRLADCLEKYSVDTEEFTVEVNPDDVTEENLEVWKRGGANRLSIGIQTFDNSLLTAIGRRHDADTARRAYRLARKHFDNISVDLMFGLPGQTIEVWKKDLDEALDMGPEHLSAYSLMYEPGTALTMLRDMGRLKEAEEGKSEEMFRILIDEASKWGYEHYEISNFAKSGFRSLHNSSYWIQKPYLGIGPSAHSYDGFRTRKANNLDLKGYIEYWASSDPIPFGSSKNLCYSETLTDEELIDEYIMTRMRTADGIPPSDFRQRFGETAYDRLLKRCRHLLKDGFLTVSDDRIALTETSILMSDAIILEMAR